MAPRPGRGVFLDLASVDRGDLDLGRLRAACERWDLHALSRPDEVAVRIRDAEVVVTNKVVLTGALLRGAPHLRLVCVAATGTNNLDLDAAKTLGIAVRNVTGYATPSVVQHVFALILSHFTRLADYRAAVARGDWSRSDHFCLLDYPIEAVDGCTLGIVGLGELGSWGEPLPGSPSASGWRSWSPRDRAAIADPAGYLFPSCCPAWTCCPSIAP